MNPTAAERLKKPNLQKPTVHKLRTSQEKRKDEVMSVEAQMNDGISIRMPDVADFIVTARPLLHLLAGA